MLIKNVAMNNKKPAEQQISKKEAKILLYNKFSNALADYKKDIKKKKLDTKLKKASKLFAVDIVRAAHKLNTKVQKAEKKIAKPKMKQNAEESVV
jgi:hypothetical protein